MSLFYFDVAIWGTVGQWASAAASIVATSIALYLGTRDGRRRRKEKLHASGLIALLAADAWAAFGDVTVLHTGRVPGVVKTTEIEDAEARAQRVIKLVDYVLGKYTVPLAAAQCAVDAASLSQATTKIAFLLRTLDAESLLSTTQLLLSQQPIAQTVIDQSKTISRVYKLNIYNEQNSALKRLSGLAAQSLRRWRMLPSKAQDEKE